MFCFTASTLGLTFRQCSTELSRRYKDYKNCAISTEGFLETVTSMRQRHFSSSNSILQMDKVFGPMLLLYVASDVVALIALTGELIGNKLEAPCSFVDDEQLAR